jgi:hypothetical protein
MYGPPGRVNWIIYGSRGAIEVEPENQKQLSMERGLTNGCNGPSK